MGEDNFSSSSSDIVSAVDLYSGTVVGIHQISGLLGDRRNSRVVHITTPLLSSTVITKTLSTFNDMDLTLTVVENPSFV